MCDLLQRWLDDLHAGEVDPEDLLITNRVSKEVDAYTHETVAVAALKRARVNDVGLSPGQSVSYVVDGGVGGVQRVRLDFETVDAYDADWYEQEAIQTVEACSHRSGGIATRSSGPSRRRQMRVWGVTDP